MTIVSISASGMTSSKTKENHKAWLPEGLRVQGLIKLAIFGKQPDELCR